MGNVNMVLLLAFQCYCPSLTEDNSVGKAMGFESILLLVFTIMSQQPSPSAVCMYTFVAYTDGVDSYLQPASTCCDSDSY